MNTLTCYVTKRYNGLFLVTGFRPIIHAVLGTDHEDAYIAYGDPVGYLNIGPEFVASVFDTMPSEVCVPHRGELFGSLDGSVTHHIYNDEYDGLFHITRSLDISIKHVCPWFVQRMFGITKVDDWVAVNFKGKVLTTKYGLSRS